MTKEEIISEDYQQWIKYLITQLLEEKDTEYSKEYKEGFNRAINGMIFHFQDYILTNLKK